MREITCYVQGPNRNTTRLGVTLHSCMRCISSIKWYVLYLQLTLLVSLQTEELWEPLTTWPNQINRWYWFTVRTMCSITFISIWCHLRQGRDPNRLVLSLSLTRLFSIFYSLPPSLPSGMCQSNLHSLLGHKWLMGLLSRFTKQCVRPIIWILGAVLS